MFYLQIRVTILCARSLAKRDLFRLPDPFVKVSVDSCSGEKGRNKGVTQNGAHSQQQAHSTEVSRNTVDPKWNQHYDLLIGLNDAITISIWNDKKINRDQKGNGKQSFQTNLASKLANC